MDHITRTTTTIVMVAAIICAVALAGIVVVSGEPANDATDARTPTKLTDRGPTLLTMRGSGSPLVVVDGVPTHQDIAPGDIESMTVLKDAASTAIYGLRGANGVILVAGTDTPGQDAWNIRTTGSGSDIDIRKDLWF